MPVCAVKKKAAVKRPRRKSVLLAQTESFHNLAVPIRVAAVQIVQQPPALIDHHDQSATRGVVLCVGLEVAGQIADALAQESNLHFRRTCILGVYPELLN